MSVHGSGAGDPVLVVTGRTDLRRLLVLAATGARYRRLQNGIAPHPAEQALLAALQAAASDPGPTDDRTEPDEPDLLRPVGASEAALLLSCSPRQVRRLVSTGALTGRKHSGTWQLDRHQVDDYAAQRRRNR